MIKTFEQFEQGDEFRFPTAIIKRKIPITGFEHHHFAIPKHDLDQRLIYLTDGSYWRSISSKNVEVVEIIDGSDKEHVKQRLQYHRDKYDEEMKKMFPWMFK
jgi:hypothetical protein